MIHDSKYWNKLENIHMNKQIINDNKIEKYGYNHDVKELHTDIMK